jgi:hypothetical protein
MDVKHGRGKGKEEEKFMEEVSTLIIHPVEKPANCG